MKKPATAPIITTAAMIIPMIRPVFLDFWGVVGLDGSPVGMTGGWVGVGVGIVGGATGGTGLGLIFD